MATIELEVFDETTLYCLVFVVHVVSSSAFVDDRVLLSICGSPYSIPSLIIIYENEKLLF